MYIYIVDDIILHYINGVCVYFFFEYVHTLSDKASLSLNQRTLTEASLFELTEQESFKFPILGEIKQCECMVHWRSGW